MNQYLEIAEQLLRRYKRPMGPKEMSEIAHDERLLPDNFHGKTPHKTFHARLSTDILDYKEASRFVRTGKGKFYLRELLDENANSQLRVFEAPRRRPPPPQEDVLVFPSRLLSLQGVDKNWRLYADQVFEASNRSYLPRMVAETTFEKKQILTYVLVEKGGKLLCFRRGQYNRAAEFLRGSDCVGFGGHVTAADRVLMDYTTPGVMQNAARELQEELSLPHADLKRLTQLEGLEIIGVLNDDSSAVGRRHFAFILKYTPTNDKYWDNPKGGEASVTRVHWIDLNKAPVGNLHEFEYWSQLCLRTYYSEFIKLQPSYRIVRRGPLKRPKLICVVGKIGGGKTLVAKNLARALKWDIANSGRILAKLLDLKPIPETPRDAFQARALDFIRSPDGPQRLARAIADEARAAPGGGLIVDGLRNMETLEELKKELPGQQVAVVFVHTPPDLAMEQYREREDPTCSPDRFFELYSADVESQIDRFLSHADAVIYNWTGAQKLLKTVRQMLAELFQR